MTSRAVAGTVALGVALALAPLPLIHRTARAQAPAPPAGPKAAALARLAGDAALRATLAERRLARTPDTRDAMVPGLVVVKFRDPGDAAAVAALAAGHRARDVSQPAFTDVHVFRLDPDADVAAAARHMAAEPGVAYAEPVGRAEMHYRPNDPLFRYQWSLEQLDLERTWDINRGVRGEVVVAIVDSGVAYTTLGTDYLQAPDLAGTTFLPGYDFVWDDDVPIDFNGHGTHVTGTVAQSTDNNLGTAGIAFNARIIPIKAVGDDIDELLGAPNVGTAVTVAQAIRFAAEHGAKVINLSLGVRLQSTTLREAVEFAVEQGAFVVASAGNSAEDGNPVFYPAAYAPEIDGVVAVAATDYVQARSPYSNTNDYVELAAPGGNTDEDLNGDGFLDGIVQQTVDLDAFFDTGRFDQFSYLFFQGTSMAAPHVTGLAALLIDQGITEPAVIEAALKHFATDLGPAGRDNEFGYGIINPRATLRGLGLAR
jgi:serine protease